MINRIHLGLEVKIHWITSACTTIRATVNWIYRRIGIMCRSVWAICMATDVCIRRMMWKIWSNGRAWDSSWRFGSSSALRMEQVHKTAVTCHQCGRPTCCRCWPDTYSRRAIVCAPAIMCHGKRAWTMALRAFSTCWLLKMPNWVGWKRHSGGSTFVRWSASPKRNWTRRRGGKATAFSIYFGKIRKPAASGSSPTWNDRKVFSNCFRRRWTNWNII